MPRTDRRWSKWNSKLVPLALQLVLCVAVNCLLVTPLSATIVVVFYGHNQIIIAADSISVGAPSGPDYHLCKIVKLDDRTFFTGSGDFGGASDVATGKVVWSLFLSAKEAFEKSSGANDDYRLARVIATWDQMMIANYEGTPELPELLQSAFLIDGIFGTSSSRKFHAYESKVFKLIPQPQGQSSYSSGFSELSTAEGTVFPIGDAEAIGYVREFFENKTERAHQLSEKWKRTDHTELPQIAKMAIEAAIEWMSRKGVIGGAVDVMALDLEGGIHWVQVKPECR